jgi:hypothetical protein
VTSGLQSRQWHEVRDKVQGYRAEKTETLRHAADLINVDLPSDVAQDRRSYALTHHFVYAVNNAIQENRLEDAYSLAEAWPRCYDESSPELFPRHPVTIAERDSCLERDDKNFESPLYLCVPQVTSLSAAETDASPWYDAGSAIEASELDWIVRAALGVVVTLDPRGRRETTHSYTLKALPGTIFIDTVEDPVRLGEILLHESAHAFLNDVLKAYDVQLDPAARWYSPWKGVKRPAYGLLHAGFAFGVLQKYFEYFAYTAPTTSAYAKVRAETGSEQWNAARDSVTDALQEVKQEPVADLLHGFLS